LDSKTLIAESGLRKTLETCLELRLKDSSLKASQVIRLFNGFYEGLPGLTVDLYANTLVLSEHDRQRIGEQNLYKEIAEFYAKVLPDVKSVLLKQRPRSES